VKRLGIIIDDVEFISAHIVDKYGPFGVPPGQEIVVAWALSDEEYNALAIMDLDGAA
jgi:hypothetical protein